MNRRTFLGTLAATAVAPIPAPEKLYKIMVWSSGSKVVFREFTMSEIRSMTGMPLSLKYAREMFDA